MPAGSSACRSPPIARSGAAARAAPAWRRKEEDFVTRLFVANHPHADPVLLVARHRLQGEGLAAAAGRAAGARQGAGQPAAARPRASASPRSCRCRRTRRPGASSTWCSPPPGGNVRRNKLSDFVQVEPQRQDRHEVRQRRRGDRRRQPLHRGRRRAADHGRPASASAFRCSDVRVFKGRDFHRRARHRARPRTTR